MSEVSHSDELVTKQDLSNFYQGILPYLGGMPDVVGGGFAPIGTIIAFMGTTAPQDYLACDGTVYNIVDYRQLALFIEAQFGSKNYFGGNGTTTFAVPDLKGEFLRGTGTNGHTNQGNGANVGTHQNATEIPECFSYNNNSLYNSSSGVEGAVNTNVDASRATPSRAAVEGTKQATSGHMISLRPTNTSILWCIKAIEPGEVYSTEERIVGTWIDGKPIYQKTMTVKAPVVTAQGAQAQTSTPHNISNIETKISCSTNNGSNVNVFGSANNTYFMSAYFDTTNLYIRANNNTWNGVNITVTMQYTKTTD